MTGFQRARLNLKRLLGRTTGYQLRRASVGWDLWPDIATLFPKGSPLTVFDVGANTGQTAVQASASLSGARIFSFEPDPTSFKCLQTNTKGLPGITCLQLGLGERDETATMYLTESSVGNSLLPFSTEISKYGQGAWTKVRAEVPVEIQRLDTCCERLGIAKLDLLKIDTQGFELKVMSGAGERLRPDRIAVILLEVNFVNLYEGQPSFVELYQFLSAHGYHLMALYGANRYNDKPYMTSCDAVFI